MEGEEVVLSLEDLENVSWGSGEEAASNSVSDDAACHRGKHEHHREGDQPVRSVDYWAPCCVCFANWENAIEVLLLADTYVCVLIECCRRCSSIVSPC